LKADAEIMLASTGKNCGFCIRGRYELQLATDDDGVRVIDLDHDHWARLSSSQPV